MKRPGQSSLSEAQRFQRRLCWTAGALTSCLAVITGARLDDFCWAVWLINVTLLTIITVVTSVKAFLLLFDADALLEPDGDKKRWRWEVKTIRPGQQLRAYSGVMIFLVFWAVCYAGFLGIYAMLLNRFFPHPALPSGTVSLTESYPLAFDYAPLLMPKYWPAVLITVILDRAHLLRSWANKFDNHFEGSIGRLYLSLPFAIPIALLIQTAAPEGETIVLILLILLFYSPAGRLRVTGKLF